MNGIASGPPKCRCPKCQALTRVAHYTNAKERGPHGEYFLWVEFACGCVLDPDREEVGARWLKVDEAWATLQRSRHRHQIVEALRRCPCYYCRMEASGKPLDGRVLDGNGCLIDAPRG